MRRNLRLALHKCFVSTVRLMFVGLCVVQVALVVSDPPRSVTADPLYAVDDDNDSISSIGSSSNRPNIGNRHLFHRRRHFDLGSNEKEAEEDDDDEEEERHSVGIRNNRSGCPVPCRCSRPEEKLHCKGGVSIIRDGCNCCFICARQQGDLCDYRHRCDEDKDQFCDYTLDDGIRGICRAQSGRACTVDGRVYGDGDHFRLNCSQLCTCQNGQYACASLCPQEDQMPSKDFCKDLQLISIAGRCCREWVCPHSPSTSTSTNSNSGNMAQTSEEDDDDPTTRPRDGRRCVKETTGWSHCSVSCGFGWSVRLTNDNDDCLSVQERRICIVRTCQLNDKHLLGRECKTTWKETQLIRIRYDSCVSIKDYRPKYCSSCKRKRCCRPELTKTLLIEMICTPSASIHTHTTTTTSRSSRSHDGHLMSNTTIVEKLMWVKSCRCKEIYCKK